uniref:Uncharacterized protein n=1 Tax=Panagrolaimus sp. PS1159 TaxID=55785 RepID=A0AC35GXE9_9BILA
MLAVVAVMSAMPFIFPSMKDFIQDNIAYYFIGYGVFIVVYFVLICIPSARRSFPYNLIAAGILNLSIGYMVMVIVSFHDVESVLIALIITTCASAAIIVFAFQTKYDFTSWIGVMCMLSWTLFIFGFVGLFSNLFFAVPWIYSVYSAVGALFFMVYLAIDVQLLMGGKRYQLDPEDYIFAAIQIFLDIVIIFLKILSLFKN